MSTPAQPIQKLAAQSAAPQAAPAPAQDQDDDATTLPEEPSGAPVNLHKAYSLLNERLAELFDHSGVKRNFAVPYVKGQDIGEHTDSLSAVLPSVGGITRNLLLTYHHAGKKGWGSEDGETTAHSSDKL